MFFLSNWKSLCIYNQRNSTHFTSRLNCVHDRRVWVSINNTTICGNCADNNVKEGICVCKRYKRECTLPEDLVCIPPGNSFCVQVNYPMDIGGRKLYYIKNKIELNLEDPYAEFLQPVSLPEITDILRLEDKEQQLKSQIIKINADERGLIQQIHNYLNGPSGIKGNYQDTYWDLIFKGATAASVLALLVVSALTCYLRVLIKQHKNDVEYRERKALMKQTV